ncbi:cation diffusion facilitator family transporter [Paenacidovorax caeni]|jgi:cation diffusion facilitator family transporter|uniref:Cation diffusion facilitator family transporter n=1 Tax=Paenacidovorax caeni TaxID=343013 RepID=A0A1I7IRI5_9BURK|nr:cation diffusion facilitator family transporter [Paenacidovorax caeni]SFU75503.1 cation diffusion facilitator family transporter [Paenacidovorax caeni]
MGAWMTPRRLLRVSVVVALLTIVLKTLAWWVTGSVGLLSDALEAFVNLAGAMFALAMVTVAERPADVEHPYGHHKAEYFSSGFEGILIVGASMAIVWASVQRLLHPQPLEQLGWGMALSMLSTGLNGLLALAMFRTARRHRAVALEGDARHLVTDVWTSVGVVIGLIAAQATGWLWLDPLVGIGVALNILYEGGALVWRAAQGLMDEAVEQELIDQIEAVLLRHSQASADVVRFDSLVSRRAGMRSYVQLHMHVPAGWTLGRAAQARAAVESELMDTVPGLHATIELLPVGAETVFEQSEAQGRSA